MAESLDQPEALRPCYGDVVSGVRRLGTSAVDSFLDGLAPYIAATATGDLEGYRRLGRYFHDWGVTVAFLDHVGGIDALRQVEAATDTSEDVHSIDDLIAAVNAFVPKR